MMNESRKTYLNSLNTLRGLAAFSVCLFHFTNGNRFFLHPEDIFRKAGFYGSFGVQVFFVISGLVIPFSMYQVQYRLSDIKTFLLKRIVRIEPPYLISFLLVLLLNIISSVLPHYQGKPLNTDPVFLLGHLGYMNSFLHLEWINPVYWTLAIEFQYYLLIAFLFPLISSKNNIVLITAALLFNAVSWLLPDPNFIFYYSFYFTLGIAICKYLVKDLTLPFFIIIVLICLAGIFIQFKLPGLIAGLIPLSFSFISWENKVTRFLGNISYSLYLLHVPVGLRVINIARQWYESELMRYIAILVAIAVTLVASYLFYRYVELPFKKMSQKIRYQEKDGVKMALQNI